MRLLAALATLIFCVGLATGASAHAALVSVEPFNASVVASQPKSVELRFNEPVTPGAIRLIDAEGRERGDARVSASGDIVSIGVPPGLPQGTVVVSYRVISQDGHPVAGSVTFSIGMPSAKVSAAATADGSVNGLIWLARIGLYLGLFVGVGGVFFASWIARSADGTAVARAALAIGVVCAIASIGLLGADLLGLPLAALFKPGAWTVAVKTSAGPALLIAGAAMLISGLALRGAGPRALSAIALAGVGLSLALTGHASSAPPETLTRPAMFLHGVGVAFWIGALVPLAALVSRQGAVALPVVERFSRLAVPVVGILALTGLALAVIQLQSFAALIETKYGLILVTKLALVLALLALAAFNRFRLTPVLTGSATAARALRRSILVESVLALGIFALVAGWRFTPPPRTIVPETPLALHIHTDKAMFQVLVTPGTAGTDDFVLQLMTGDASPLVAKEVTLTLSLPERGIEPMEHDAELGADGYWHVRKVELPFAGKWHVRIEALVTDFEKVTLEDELEVAPR